MNNTDNKNEIMQESAARIVRLSKENARFEMKNKFLALTVVEDDTETSYDRVFLHRVFPHELFWEYISVTDEDSREIGIIYNIEEFDSEMTDLIRREITRKYYSPVIKEIHKLKERYGFSYWTVVMEDGKKLSFTMQDTYKNIIHTGEDSAFIIDVDGNRYTLKSISKLDRRSYRKIELYL